MNGVDDIGDQCIASGEGGQQGLGGCKKREGSFSRKRGGADVVVNGVRMVAELITFNLNPLLQRTSERLEAFTNR